MPTYLTPGVYVEEVSSGNKPIEGVATSVAASSDSYPEGRSTGRCGSRTGLSSPTSTATRSDPENGPFMEGSFTAHAVYGYFMNGGSLAWIIRVGSGEAPKARAALPAAADKEVEALRAVALDGVTDTVRVEVAEEPTQEGKDGEPTYKLTVTSGGDSEEYDGVTVEEGTHIRRDKDQCQPQSSSKLKRPVHRCRMSVWHRHVHPVGSVGSGRQDHRRRLRGRCRDAAWDGQRLGA